MGPSREKKAATFIRPADQQHTGFKTRLSQ